MNRFGELKQSPRFFACACTMQRVRYRKEQQSLLLLLLLLGLLLVFVATGCCCTIRPAAASCFNKCCISLCIMAHHPLPGFSVFALVCLCYASLCSSATKCCRQKLMPLHFCLFFFSTLAQRLNFAISPYVFVSAAVPIMHAAAQLLRNRRRVYYEDVVALKIPARNKQLIEFQVIMKRFGGGSVDSR